MNPTYPAEHQDRPGSFSIVTGARALHGLERPDWLTTTQEACEIGPVDFTYSWEEEFARMLDEHRIPWQYKHRTFAVEWDEEGNFVDSFTPDFYLPGFDVYVELVATDYGALGGKARKVRLLRQQHPDIRIELVNTSSPSLVLGMFS